MKKLLLGLIFLLTFSVNVFASHSVNIATGTATAIDSTYGAAANAVDGSVSSYWGPNAAPPTTAWWKLDLGAGLDRAFGILSLYALNAGGLRLKDFVLAGSNNDSSYSDIYTGQYANSSGWQDFAITNSTNYRYYRLTVSTTWSGTGYGIEEVKMTGVTLSDDQVLLLHLDGANNSTMITDSGSYATAWTARGDAKISTAQSVFGGASCGFDGTGDYLDTPNTYLWDSTSLDMTISMRVYFTAIAHNTWLISQSNGSNDHNWAVYAYTTGKVGIGLVGTNEIASATGVVTTGQWYHIEIDKAGTTTYIFVNGHNVASATTGVWDKSLNLLTIGAGAGGTANTGLNGYVDEVMVEQGVALHTSDFTPPTSPYGAGGGTTVDRKSFGKGMLIGIGRGLR